MYLNSLDDGLDLARVLGYDTIRNEWFTVLDAQMGSPGDLSIGSGYWVFVREAAALVPGGVASTGGTATRLREWLSPVSNGRGGQSKP